MAWTSSASGSQTAVIGTEHSLATPTAIGTYVAHIDTVNMVNGDLLELRVYKKVDGTNYRQVWKGTYQHIQINLDKQTPPIEIGSLSGDQLKFTLKQTAGTGRVFPWNIDVI